MTHNRRLEPEFIKLLGSYSNDILPVFFEAFYENSRKTRQIFFSDKVI
jgi:hypothetical protein